MSRITYIGTLYELGQLSVRRRLPETTAWVVGGVAHRLNGSVAEVHQLPPQTVLGEHRTQRRLGTAGLNKASEVLLHDLGDRNIRYRQSIERRA